MSSFSITLTNLKTRLYDRFAVFIFLISAAAILILLFTKVQPVFIKISGALTATVLTAAIIVYSRASLKSRRKVFFLAASALTMLYWLISGYWWAAIVNVLLSALYLAAQQVPVVKVDSNRVRYPSFPPRSLRWNELNNMILKDGLLTIDLKNNTLIQQAIDENINTINEQNFNEFCMQQLKQNAVK